ncbi:MAG: hypothetical protein ACXVEB_15425 [Bacteroidia bacterium]
MKKILSIIAIALTIITASSCKKAAGEGGNSKIIGNIWAQKWNNSLTVMSGEGPGANIDVFIIYGDDTSYGNKISSSPDGTFEFQYLRPGKYTIYSYSKALITSTNPNGKVEVKVDTEITKKKQTVDVGRIQVNI